MTTVSYRSFTSPQVPLSILARSPSKFCTFNITAIFSLLFFPPSPRGFYFRNRRELILLFGRDPRKVTLFGCNLHIPGKSPLLVLVFLPVLENTKTCFAKYSRGSPFPEIEEQTCRELAGVCPAPALRSPYFILWLLLFKCLFVPAHLLKMWHLAPSLLCDMPGWCWAWLVNRKIKRRIAGL